MCRELKQGDSIMDEGNQNDLRHEKPKTCSRLRIEARIGVAVIGLLLMVLVAVVAIRLTRSNSAVEVAATGSEEKSAGGIPGPGVQENKDMVEDTRPQPLAGEKGPTVVTPKPAADRYERYAVEPPAVIIAENVKPLSDSASRAKVSPPGEEPSASEPRLPSLTDVKEPEEPPALEPPAILVADDVKPLGDSGNRTKVSPPVEEPLASEPKRPEFADRKEPAGPRALEPSAVGPRYADFARNTEPQLPPPLSVGQPDSDGRYGKATAIGGDHAPKVRTYTVMEGDTVFSIARRELGRALRWVEVYDLNRGALGNDLNHLAPGTELNLP
jgi:nucleoid-associated protein YgaU